MAGKTMRRIVAVAIALILMAGAACAGLFILGSNSPLETARAHAINLVLDQAGLKNRIESELYKRADQFAEKTGVPVEIVNKAIDVLDVKHWEAATLPKNLKETGSFETDIGGHTISFTSYDDPSYVTLAAHGQEVTFDVPKSAEVYTTIIPYAETASDFGVTDMLGAILG